MTDDRPDQMQAFYQRRQGSFPKESHLMGEMAIAFSFLLVLASTFLGLFQPFLLGWSDHPYWGALVIGMWFAAAAFPSAAFATWRKGSWRWSSVLSASLAVLWIVPSLLVDFNSPGLLLFTLMWAGAALAIWLERGTLSERLPPQGPRL